MPEPKRYDAAVIGTGQGGKPLAVALAKAGWKTAVIERQYIGGTCVNVGCVPKKLLAYAAQFAREFADAGGYGWDVPVRAFDWPTLIAHKPGRSTFLTMFPTSGT